MNRIPPIITPLNEDSGDINALWYRYWQSLATPQSSGIPDAPSDGTLYGRKDAAWVPVPQDEPVNLGYTEAPDQGTVTNTAGTDAVLPVYNQARAGLTPAPLTNTGTRVLLDTGWGAIPTPAPTPQDLNRLQVMVAGIASNFGYQNVGGSPIVSGTFSTGIFSTASAYESIPRVRATNTTGQADIRNNNMRRFSNSGGVAWTMTFAWGTGTFSNQFSLWFGAVNNASSINQDASATLNSALFSADRLETVFSLSVRGNPAAATRVTTTINNVSNALYLAEITNDGAGSIVGTLRRYNYSLALQQSWSGSISMAAVNGVDLAPGGGIITIGVQPSTQIDFFEMTSRQLVQLPT